MFSEALWASNQSHGCSVKKNGILQTLTTPNENKYSTINQSNHPPNNLASISNKVYKERQLRTV